MKKSLIDLAFLSEKRKDVLLLLEEGPKSGDDIKTALNVKSTSIMPQIKKLKDGHLIVQDKRNVYQLSGMGDILIEKMGPLLDTVRVFEENYDYWVNHDLTVIPEYLLNKISELGNYFMLEADLNRLFEIPEDLKSNLLRSRYVKIFLSYFNPIYLEIYSELIRKGVELHLILTEPIFIRMEKDYYENLKFLIESKNTEIYICNKKVNLENIVTERFCSLVLFDKKGTFDHQRLIDYDESAIKWCEELFLYYKEASLVLKKL